MASAPVISQMDNPVQIIGWLCVTFIRWKQPVGCGCVCRFSVMSCCWSLNPDERPRFTPMLACLQNFYTALGRFVWHFGRPRIGQLHYITPESVRMNQCTHCGRSRSRRAQCAVCTVLTHWFQCDLFMLETSCVLCEIFSCLIAWIDSLTFEVA